jgi:allantoinase
MLNAANYAKAAGKVLAVHAEDRDSIEYKRDRAKRLRRCSWRDYCFARNDISESIAVNKMIRFARISETPIHIVHLSSELGLDAIERAQQENVKISAETCPHFLHFTQQDFENPKIANYLKTAPPVKKDQDREALWKGLREGKLNFVATDHAGCDPDKEKISDNFWEVYAGIPGVEHRVPYLFSEGFLKGELTLEQTVNLLSRNAAEFFNIPRKGKLENGFDADFVLIDPWTKSVIRSAGMHSKGKYSPFNGARLKCTVNTTFLRGSMIMSKDDSAKKEIGYGEFIKL